MRLFVALPIPEAQQEQLVPLMSGLAGARWVRAEGLHLTLSFIGEVSRPQAEEIDAALLRIDAPGFDLTLSGLGSFGDPGKTRALWVGVEPEPALNHLQTKVETALRRADVKLDARKFKPHVTLARFKQDPLARLHDYVARHSPLKLAPFAVEGFTLFTSFLTEEGSVYQAAADYPLRWAVPPARALHAG